MVHPTGLAAAGVNEVWSDESVGSYARVAEMVHEAGAHIFGQLSHLGRQGDTFAAHRELWAPSALADPASRVVPHAMNGRDIAEMIESYAKAAGRLRAAGFDGLEVYLAHGYLLCEFLSRFSNRRSDQYGGSLENRCRLPLEVLAAVRAVVGEDFPVGIRVSADEFVPDGITPGECAESTGHLLARCKIDYVSVSQSNYASIDRMIPDMSYPRAPFAHYAKEVRGITEGVPVFAVARLITPEQCEELLAAEAADAVCLVRPLIADPYWAAKAAEGRRDDIRECISCNVGCRGGPHRGSPIACLVNPAVGYEKDWGVGRLGRSERPRKVLVVGGGPAGLKSAETAAMRGHEVTLLEASDRLGGQVLLAAAAMPYRDEFANSVRYLERQILKLKVEVITGKAACADSVRERRPDCVIVATGSLPGGFEVPGGEGVISVHDALSKGVPGGKVVLIDAGEAGWKICTTAENLTAAGCEVTLVTPVSVGASMDAFSRPPMLRRLREAGVKFLEYHVLAAVDPEGARVRETLTGRERLIEADCVVGAAYGVANDGLFLELLEGVGGGNHGSQERGEVNKHGSEVNGRGIGGGNDGKSGRGTADAFELHAVGDCLAPRQAIDAIWDAFRVASAL